jgi:endonuclease/exonuclease/phosphatase family metal-dependent hydrolase
MDNERNHDSNSSFSYRGGIALKLSLTTFNLRLDSQLDGYNRYLERKKHLLPYIQQHATDILCFQEVLPFMKEDLIQALPNHTVVGEFRKAGSEAVPIAINTKRFQIKEDITIWLTNTPLEESILARSAHPRIATICKLSSVELDHPFLIVNTHLDYMHADVIEQQMHYLMAYIDSRMDWMNYPILLAGDFNQTPDSAVCTFLQSRGFTSVYESLPPNIKTFHGFQPIVDGKPIDYWFYTNHFQFVEALIDISRPKDGYYSDHYPVYLVVHL